MRTDDPIYTLTPPERRGRAKRRDSGWSTPLECGFRRLAGNSTGRVVPSFLSSSLGTRLSAKLCFVRAVSLSGTEEAGAAGTGRVPKPELGHERMLWKRILHRHARMAKIRRIPRRHGQAMREGGGGDEAVFYGHGAALRFQPGEEACPSGRGRGVKVEHVKALGADGRLVCD